MRTERLTDCRQEGFRAAFALYEQSFPLHERRTLVAQCRRMDAPGYHFDLLLEEEELCGILLWWEAEGTRYVEHLAVCPGLRGSGTGSRALAAFLREGGPVVLEIDPPVDPLSRRRQEFYRRNGFFSNPYPHVHPPYRKGFPGHPLVVMSSPAPISRTEYRQFYRFLDRVVMADCKPPLEEKEEKEPRPPWILCRF